MQETHLIQRNLMKQIKSIVIFNDFVKLKLSKQAVNQWLRKLLERQLRLDI